MKPEPDTETEIRNILNRVFETYSQGKLDEVISFFAPHPDVTYIGIGAGTKCVGLDNIKSFLRQAIDQNQRAQGFSSELKDPIISEHGGVAWISAGVKVQFKVEGEIVEIYFRNTTTFIKQNNKWLIAQMHNSAPLEES
jgi:hypothetical protein